jgi:hypothetical protein
MVVMEMVEEFSNKISLFTYPHRVVFSTGGIFDDIDLDVFRQTFRHGEELFKDVMGFIQHLID